MESSQVKQSESLVAEKIRVKGTVQGVGFRPTVYRLAKECGLRGTVGNDGQGVLILAIATSDAIDTFVARLQAESPPLAKIAEIIRYPDLDTNVDDFNNFVIVQSKKSNIRTEIPPDAATCSTCQQEIFNSSSRWYGYPFTNCTHCGPRLSIIKHLPYDRVNTSMVEFQMCPDCARDYHNPRDRRFHAQPIACSTFGAYIWLEKAGEQGRQGSRVTAQGLRPVRNEINRVSDLFDAVAAVIGICRESCSYEGQAAIALEALAEEAILSNPEQISPYPFTIENRELKEQSYLPYIEPCLMWQALLKDLRSNTAQSIIAAKFHLGLADAIAYLVEYICSNHENMAIIQVVLTGGVFQNQILLNQVTIRLEAMNLQVLTHSQVPPNDGGISLGQAAIALCSVINH